MPNIRWQPLFSIGFLNINKQIVNYSVGNHFKGPMAPELLPGVTTNFGTFLCQNSNHHQE